MSFPANLVTFNGHTRILKAIERHCLVFHGMMPKFKKKTEDEGRGEWFVENMKLAMQDVLENKILVRTSPVWLNFSRRTLKRIIRIVETESR